MNLFSGKILPNIHAIALLIMLSLPEDIVCQTGILDSLFTFRAGIVKTGNALGIISRQTGYNFTYDSRLVDAEKKTTLSFRNTKLSVILDSILKNDSLAYSIIDKYIIISRIVPSTLKKADPGILSEVNYISGIVIDDESRTPLPSATIGLKSTGRGTISNNNGEFSLRITPDCINDTLVVSYLGYYGREIPVKQSVANSFTITLKREFISIQEIIIRNQIPQDIISKSLLAVNRNYGNTPSLLTGFYREGVMKKNKLQSYSEAILDIYKSAYSGSFQRDQIKVFRSRKIENISYDDTLTVRLKAGLSTALELDGVKNTFDFISPGSNEKYTYRITDIISFDDEAAYLIEFTRKKEEDVLEFNGSLYINTDDYAILRAVYEISPESLQKMRESFISAHSRGFVTWPVSVRYSVSYRKVLGRYFLSHVRGDLVFSSRQKRKLFRTQFKVFLELAITGMNTKNVSKFEREDLAPIHSVFSKTITDYDSEFWKNQDFLMPEEDLLQALKNLNVRMHEYPGESP